MKKYLVVAAALVFSFSTFFGHNLLAEEAKQPAVQETKASVPEATPAAPAGDETEFSYGTVKSAGADQLVISEYDYDSDKDVDVTYSVPVGTKFENVASLQEIKTGDAVDIDFLVKNGQKVASSITVEKATAENEEAALGVADEGVPGKTE